MIREDLKFTENPVVALFWKTEEEIKFDTLQEAYEFAMDRFWWAIDEHWEKRPDIYADGRRGIQLVNKEIGILDEYLKREIVCSIQEQKPVKC